MSNFIRVGAVQKLQDGEFIVQVCLCLCLVNILDVFITFSLNASCC